MMDMETTGLRWRWWPASLLPRLAGPIFDKEMRVSSRRRRNYVLRFLYIGFFTFLVACVWLNDIVHSTTSVYQASRMAAAGQAVITSILWFQFIAAQVIAVVMLSTSISDEIYKRTLGVLMTTPIGSFQIVIGKLASRLLQIVLLLAISLPLLAVVRVFGGVPWGFLLCGLCVTLTTVTFVGSLSLFFSIFTRQAYVAIIGTILMIGFLFGGLPALLAALTHRIISSNTLEHWLSYVNPFLVMVDAMVALYGARATILGVWPLHCGIMLGLTALLLLLAMIFVRKAALRQAVGGGVVAPKKRRAGSGPAVLSIRRVQGPPVLWKERRIPLFGRRKTAPGHRDRLRPGDPGPAAPDLRTVPVRENAPGRGDPRHVRRHLLQHRHSLYRGPAGYLHYRGEGVPDVAAAVDDDRRQLGDSLGQVRGRRTPLSAGLGVAVRPYDRVHGAAESFIRSRCFIWRSWRLWVVFFLTSTGLYFSTRLRHTTTAVIANLGLAAGLWAVFPLFLAILLGVTRTQTGVLETYMDLNPFVHAGVIVNAAAHRGGLGCMSGCREEWATCRTRPAGWS